MLVGSMLILTFHGKNIRIWASIFTGIGFGLFIDEAGKFVIHDNNYFFQPTTVNNIFYFHTIIFNLFVDKK